tara:strand:+ start:2440 stop:2898 length:459 start_codon:yes stop_codon:yes gene_type:complete
MTNDRKIPTRGVGKKPLGGNEKKLSDVESESASAINSAPLAEKKPDEFDKAPRLTASEIIGKESSVEDIYSKEGKGDQHFAVYLNRYEVTALCLVMDAYDMASRNHVVRRFGVTRAVEIAETKLGMTEQTCEEFYKSGKIGLYAKKRTSRRG